MGYIGKASRKALKAIGFASKVKTTEDDKELLDTIRKHVQLDLEATAAQRLLESDDRRYMDPATQWDDEDRSIREQAGRPCLTEDNLGPFLRNVCNEQRKNKPGVQVNPVDSGSDPDTAEIAQGLIRHIEYSSNADTAYDTAFRWAAATGRGFYRLTTDYVDQEGFEQEILIKRCPDPWLVFTDPAAQESDYSDMNWGGFKAWVSREDFKALYPDSDLSQAGTSEWLAIGDDAPDWMNEDASAVLVVEYFYKKQTKRTIEADGMKRDTYDTKVCWVKCTAVEVIERGELPGTYIPIIAVLGEENINNGQRTYAGIIRAGKDPQKRLNYMLTSQVERIAFMPLATWVGAKGFMGKNAAIWKNAHKNQMAALEFEIIGDDGQGINAPRLITEEAPIVAVTHALEGSKEGLKSTLGMYDPNMGREDGSKSGIAIQRLQMQGETGNYHLQDNLGRAIRYEGRIILSWLPTYYDTERIIRIIGEDGTQKQVRVNGPIQNPGEALSPEHIGKVFDLTAGKYDVTISAGPSYQSKRQEDRAMLQAMLGSPLGEVIAQRAGDLVAKTLDSPIAKELAKRLTPPDIAQQEQQEGGASPQIPPQLMQQLQQSGQMIEQLTQTVNSLHDEIEGEKAKAAADLAKAQLDSQTKLQIAQMDNEAKILIAEAQIAGNGMLPELKAKVDELNQQQEELAELALHLHGAIMPPEALGQSGTIPVEPELAPVAPSPAVPAGVQPEPAGPMAGME